MAWSVFYVAAIAAINVGFSYVPLIPLPNGEMFPPLALAVGFVFVLRDLAQRQVGHRVLWAMGAGLVVSYALADPYVATASAVAFAISEVVDWAIYTVTRRPLAERIIFSSLISTPVDSAVFLLMIGHFGVVGFSVMTLSKIVGAAVVWGIIRTTALT